MRRAARNAVDRESVSFGARLAIHAGRSPGKPAIRFAPHDGDATTMSWRDLERSSNQVARLLADQGVDQGSFVVVGLPNLPEHYVVSYAVWKLGACVVPINPGLPATERADLVRLAKPRAVVSDWTDVTLPAGKLTLSLADLAQASEYSADAIQERVSLPGKAIASGGSSGRPKLIVSLMPWTEPRTGVTSLGQFAVMQPGQVHLVAAPIYHNLGFTWSHHGLLNGHTLILMDHFDASRAVDLIERHQVEYMALVPTMMQRIARLPGIRNRDLSSLTTVFHAGSPCAPWVKEEWIRLVGAPGVVEAYGATEGVGATRITGDEWLSHRGSVGRPMIDPIATRLRIQGPNGEQLPAHEIGEIFTRTVIEGPTHRYLGSRPATRTDDGFVSVGDLGWVDEDGYLFVADRRVDLIITGGVNVYPAEVEAVLTELQDVADAAVIGLPDEEWGRRVHAVIRPRDQDNPPSATSLDAHCRERLAPHKRPKSYGFVTSLPRDEAGKIRRASLINAAQGTEPGW